jgi:hypothetical protein
MKAEGEGTRTGEPEGWVKGSAKVQSGAKLLCKSAKVGFEVGRRLPSHPFQTEAESNRLLAELTTR